MSSEMNKILVIGASTLAVAAVVGGSVLLCKRKNNTVDVIPKVGISSKDKSKSKSQLNSFNLNTGKEEAQQLTNFSESFSDGSEEEEAQQLANFSESFSDGSEEEEPVVEDKTVEEDEPIEILDGSEKHNDEYEKRAKKHEKSKATRESKRKQKEGSNGEYVMKSRKQKRAATLKKHKNRQSR